MNRAVFVAVLLIAALAASQAFALDHIVDNRLGGLNYAYYADSGWANSSGNVNAPGSVPNIGSRYSSTGTYFGPSRYAAFSFAPTTAGFYEVALSWTNTAGQKATAVNIYSGSHTGSAAADIWGNTGGPTDVLLSGTMDMYYRAPGVWNTFGTVQMNTGLTYKIGIYAGYKTPYAGGVTPEDTLANRVASGGARFRSATPGAAANNGIADGATDVPLTGSALSWIAGNYSSFFDIYLDTNSAPSAAVATGLTGTGLSLDGLSLQPLTTYYWMVKAGNVDKYTDSPVYSFTTGALVPEPASILALCTGIIGIIGIRRRK